MLVETTALLQRRIGVESVRDFNLKILPLLEIIWVDAEWNARAVQGLFVDCLSLEIMESRSISRRLDSKQRTSLLQDKMKNNAGNRPQAGAPSHCSLKFPSICNISGPVGDSVFFSFDFHFYLPVFPIGHIVLWSIIQ